MFTLIKATNPIWFNAEQTAINLEVQFEEFANEVMPFLATSYDIEPHGVDLFNRAKAGEFGTVAPYVPPPEPIQPKTTGTITA
jgi:hypothetical protein